MNAVVLFSSVLLLHFLGNRFCCFFTSLWSRRGEFSSSRAYAGHVTLIAKWSGAREDTLMTVVDKWKSAATWNLLQWMRKLYRNVPSPGTNKQRNRTNTGEWKINAVPGVVDVCCSLKSEPNEKVFFDEELNAFAWWGREIINLPVCCSVDLRVARSGLEKENTRLWRCTRLNCGGFVGWLNAITTLQELR